MIHTQAFPAQANFSFDKFAARLKERRPERRPAKETRQAVDVIFAHLERHGSFLWGHIINLFREPSGVRLVDRTNNALEGFFLGMKHGERRRSGRKILTQDCERLRPEAALALNPTQADHVEIIFGTIENLPQALSTTEIAHTPCA